MAYPKYPPHARIFRSWMDLPAWTTLKPVSQALLVALMSKYRPHEPNVFEISDRTATLLVNCSRNTARKALEELENRGWLRVTRFGRMYGPKAKRASAYCLLMFPEEPGMPPEKPFLRWKPDPVQRLKIKPSTDHIRAVNGSLQPPKQEAIPCAFDQSTH